MRINGYSYPPKIVLSLASITLQEWQSKYYPNFPFFPANEENGSAAALSETRNLNESFLKKRQSNEPRRAKEKQQQLLFSRITFHNKPTKNPVRAKIRSSNPSCVIMDRVVHGKLCLVQRLSLCKSGKANAFPLSFFSR
ncbi:hypothetical protein CDAR_281421 [Caerostris darwini]|uniref:Uncharacterized protein n=1 Tax=Caerostris darwini TaxID=1538125 RepID=A0AAV4TF61_9ARAC|nr:hypothetical protein CDAR_281421 [Caerostris darwini]